MGRPNLELTHALTMDSKGLVGEAITLLRYRFGRDALCHTFRNMDLR
jgi:hypothetical protein